MRSPRLACLVCLLILTLACRAADEAVLARVDMTAAVPASGLPVHRLLQDAQGLDYALVIASAAALRGSGCAFQLLATNAAPKEFVIAETRRPALRAQLAQLPECVYDDGRHVVLRRTADFMAHRQDYGAILQPLLDTPVRWDEPANAASLATSFPCVSNPTIAAMMNQVSSNRIWWLIAQLSGETNFNIGATSYTMFSRHTRYGSPFQKDAAFIYQTLTNLQFQTQYFRWSASGYASSNVIATMTGTTRANEIVLLMAHLDDIWDSSQTGRTPGADDNASGCAALLVAAERLADYTFERTLQLAFVTGEEQNLYGSAAYAANLAGQSANVVAVYNFDVIAYSTNAQPSFGVHTRIKTDPGYAADLPLAQLYTNVMKTYGLAGAAASIVADGELYSDHASFWDQGYPAVLAIENYNNYNDNYVHTANDKLQYCNIAYCTAVVKGGVGTAAHAAVLVPEPSLFMAGCAALFLMRTRRHL